MTRDQMENTVIDCLTDCAQNPLTWTVKDSILDAVHAPNMEKALVYYIHAAYLQGQHDGVASQWHSGAM